MRTIPKRFPYLLLYFHEICYKTTAVRHTTGKDHSTFIHAHLLAVIHDAPKCGFSCSVHPQCGHRSGGNNILFLSTTYCDLHVTARYMILYLSRFACFESIFSPLLNTPTHPPDTLLLPLSVCKEIWCWTRGRLAIILGTDFRYIPTTWLFLSLWQYDPDPNTAPAYGF
jgi:hypothetical protein